MRQNKAVPLITLLITVFTLGGAGYMAALASKLPKGLGPSALGPGRFPLFVFYAIVAGSILLGVGTLAGLLKSDKAQKNIGPRPPVFGYASKASPTNRGQDNHDTNERKPFLRILAVVAGFTAVVALWHFLGFLPTSTLFIAITSYFLGEPKERNIKTAGMATLWALGFTGVMWLIFVKLLHVPLPGGLFFEW